MNTQKIHRHLLLSLVLVPLAWLLSCAHQPAERDSLQAEAAAQPRAAVGGELAAQSRQAIQASSSINAAQKEQLLDLHKKLAGQARVYQEEMGKMKMLLVKSLMDPKAEPKKIASIKDRILDLDRRNINKMLAGFEDAQRILGRHSAEDEHLYRAFLMDRGLLDNRQ